MKNKITTWDNTDGSYEQYICETTLYIWLILSHAYNIVFYRGAGAPVHRKYVVDSLNATIKRFLPMLMKTVKLPGAHTNNSHMVMHTAMINTDIILARVF